MINYGLLKITNDYIICRSGFKYIKFDPQIQYFPDKGIYYKEKLYQLIEGRLFLRFQDEDIVKETMSSITLKDCQFLSESVKTFEPTRQKTIVTDTNFHLFPIVARISGRSYGENYDLIHYSPEDYIKIQSDVGEDGKSKSYQIEKSDKNLSDSYILDRISEYLLNFLGLTRQRFLIHADCMDENLSNEKIINSEDANKATLERFKNKYNDEFLLKQNISLGKFSTMDVIDLKAIDQINLTFDHMDYPILEISKSSISHKGSKLDSKALTRLEDKKYYYLFVYDCHQHCIIKNKNKTMLNINNSDNHPKEGLFIKFNYESAKKYVQDIIISQLTSS